VDVGAAEPISGVDVWVVVATKGKAEAMKSEVE